MTKSMHDSVLPFQRGEMPAYAYPSVGNRRLRGRAGVATVALAALAISLGFLMYGGHLKYPFVGGAELRELDPFYYTVNTHNDLCVGGVSHSGYIGLKGDTEHTPRRAFYWYVPLVSLQDSLPIESKVF